MALSRFSLAWIMVANLASVAWAGNTFIERDGVVSIEAEHYTDRTGRWHPVREHDAVPGGPQSSVKAMKIKSGAFTDNLRYAIHFSQTGNYRVWLRGRSQGKVDELRVLFRPENRGQSDSSVFNISLPLTLGWANQLQSIRVEQPGWYRLLLVKGKRSKWHWDVRDSERSVDKIVLLREPSITPSGDGPEETINAGSQPVPESTAPLQSIETNEVWELRDGYVVIEPEPIVTEGWCYRDQPSGFTGAGYRIWDPCDDREDDVSSRGKGEPGVEPEPPDTWLTIRLRLKKAGRYRVDLRNYHSATQPEIECRIGRLDEDGLPEPPFYRSGDSLNDGPGFSWLDWGAPAFDLKAGVNTLYLVGASPSFAVDRIAIYRDGDAAAKAKALNPETRDSLPTETE
ncbi:MAG: hypothetical protein EHM23_27085 [Acidobacteria bacterium]|nr:MAG: hypothetical protein EHM23_27085 [Acidobacteriota bacterium]